MEVKHREPGAVLNSEVQLGCSYEHSRVVNVVPAYEAGGQSNLQGGNHSPRQHAAVK